MKKEFKINITKSETSTNGHLLICVSIDKFLIGMFSMSKGGLCVFPRKEVSDLLGVYHGDFHGYLSIPEIKKLYDEHFNKEIDLFEFVGNQVTAYFINDLGIVNSVYFENNQYKVNMLTKHYNLFPTKELAEKARPMSLDERKRLLFANAKGYAVLTREEAIMHDCNRIGCETVPLRFDGEEKRWEINEELEDYTSNIYFKEREHAQECADFMNETKGVSE